jgi:glycosyltransferase involved in cell wall biosynthesis
MDNIHFQLRYKKIKKNEFPVFAYMGIFDIKRFGIDTILYAFADYKHKFLESGSLWLIGEGKDERQIQLLSENLGISQYVSIKQLPQGMQKFELLNQIDLFLRPSRGEYFPTAVIEAASVSVPSIVTGGSAISEHVKEYNAGFVMEENNYKQLTKLMLQSLKDIKYNNWSSKKINSLRMANEKFFWNKIVRTHISNQANS